MKIIKENNLPIITTNHPEEARLIKLLTVIQGYIQDFIEVEGSPLWELSAKLHSIVYHETDFDGTITIIFDITKCKYTSQHPIDLAAQEACSTEIHGLPYILDNSIPMVLSQYQHIVTGTTLIFTGYFEF